MSQTLAISGLVLELVDRDLGPPGVFDHLAGHRDLGQSIGVRGDRAAVDEQHRGQLNRFACRLADAIELDGVIHGPGPSVAGTDGQPASTRATCSAAATDTCYKQSTLSI